MINNYLPSNLKNVLGLAWRLIFKGKPAGRAAMVYSAIGLVLVPIDIFLSIFERRLYRNSKGNKHAQIFVCGPPRSGTTVVAQCLMKYLPVFYLSNLTSLFPRSPIMANKLLGWVFKTPPDELPLRSFYGRTTKLSYPNDALYIWDRWTNSNRETVPTHFSEEAKRNMFEFFSALEEYSEQALLNKNNSLNTFAQLVAEVLPNSYFICLDRDPIYLAQSHFIARKFIHGDESTPYGILGDSTPAEDPIDDICKQVNFHKRCALRQQRKIGSDRFLILSYEDFCARPAHWICKLSEQILGRKLDRNNLSTKLTPLKIANHCKIDPLVFAKIKRRMEQIKNESDTIIKIAK